MIVMLWAGEKVVIDKGEITSESEAVESLMRSAFTAASYSSFLGYAPDRDLLIEQALGEVGAVRVSYVPPDTSVPEDAVA